jgi:FkbM family methyltransferase
MQQIEFHLPTDYYYDDLETTHEGWAITSDDIQHGHWITKQGDINHDPAFTSWIADWCVEGSVMVDVGAGIGTHSIPYLRREPGWLISIEAARTTFECLRRNLLLEASHRPFRTNLTAYCCGISDDFGTADFHYNESTPGMSFLSKNANGNGIEVRPLDHLLECVRDRYISVMKIDVEGFEPYVILGGKNTLNPLRGAIRPVIVMEINHAWLERNGWNAPKMWELMKSLNYVEMGKWPPKFDSLSHDELFTQPVFDVCWRPT